VYGLRHVEEVCVAGYHRPLHVPAGVDGVGEQGAEHLRDATTFGRRVDVPNGAPVEEICGLRHALTKVLDAFLGQDRVQPVDGLRLEVY
jgi:hypothetical protein